MRSVSERRSAMIDRVVAADTDSFTELVAAAGLSPDGDFRDALLRGVDFGGCDLGDYDFSGTTFAGCRFRGAFVAGARFDGATFEGSQLREARDFHAWALANGAVLGRGATHARTAAITAGSYSDPWVESVGPSNRAVSLAGGDPAPRWRRGAVAARCLFEVADLAQLRRAFGNRYADTLMFEVARRIGDMLPHSRVAASGSVVEFGFGRDVAGDVRADLERVLHLLSSVPDIQGREVALEVRAGAATMPLGELDHDRLASAAEAALARTARAGDLVVVGVGEPPRGRRPTGLDEDLLAAIAGDGLTLQYKPRIDLRRNEVSSVQAVLSWRHPDLGILLPGDLADLSRDAAVARALAGWTLARVAEDQRSLSADGVDLAVFVEMPAVLLRDPEAVDGFCAEVGRRGLRVGVEVAEAALVEGSQELIEGLGTIRGQGIRVAIGGYGAGLSSLALLKRASASELRIDRSLITDLVSSTRDPLVVRSTIDLAHALEMEIVADGVETPAVLALLSVMGCDLVQGSLISRPLGLEALRLFLKSGGSPATVDRGRRAVPMSTRAWPDDQAGS